MPQLRISSHGALPTDVPMVLRVISSTLLLRRWTFHPQLNSFMKFKVLRLSALLILVNFLARGQGAFLYDQQSSTDESPFPYGAGGPIQQLATPYGQSFTPTFSTVDFVRLNLNDNDPNNGLGATLYVNLRTGSINGTIVTSSMPITLANSFTGVVDFNFANSVSLTPNAVYYFEPIVQSGDQWNIIAAEYGYPDGTAFSGGFAVTGSDFWFREGIIVPEPTSVGLMLLGVGGLVLYRRHKR